MPDLAFEVTGAEVEPFAAVPTLLFKLFIRNAVPEEQIQAIMLRAQLRLQATQRQYDKETASRLLELFGEPGQWGNTVRSLLWTHAAVTVSAFSGSVVVDLPITCTYDFDVAGAKYLYALEDGDIPLLFLFSGTILYLREGTGLQIAQIPWEQESSFRLPVHVWKQMMDRYFPNSAWLRVRKDVFDRLYHYKAQNALLTWEDALERLLPGELKRET